MDKEKIIAEFDEWWEATQYMREWSIKLQAGLAWTNGWMIALEMKDKIIKKILSETTTCTQPEKMEERQCEDLYGKDPECINCMIEWAEKEIKKEEAEKNDNLK